MGGVSEWDPSARVLNMDDYIDVLKTVMNDEEYYWQRENLHSIEWIWEHLENALKENNDQIRGPIDASTQAVLFGMSINWQGNIDYTNTFGLNTLTFSGYRHGMNKDRYRYAIADYLQNKTGKGFDYRKAAIDADVIRANPKAVTSLVRRGEKAIMAEPDSYKKYLALRRKVYRDGKTGKMSMSDSAYSKYNDLYSKYNNYQYSDRYKSKYGKEV